jgi:hypothetical protein
VTSVAHHADGFRGVHGGEVRLQVERGAKDALEALGAARGVAARKVAPRKVRREVRVAVEVDVRDGRVGGRAKVARKVVLAQVRVERRVVPDVPVHLHKRAPQRLELRNRRIRRREELDA